MLRRYLTYKDVTQENIQDNVRQRGYAKGIWQGYYWEGAVMLQLNRIQIAVIKQYAEIECMFACHGGDIDALQKKAIELAHTPTMSFKQAVAEVLHEDQQTRQQPVGLLGSMENIIREAA